MTYEDGHLTITEIKISGKSIKCHTKRSTPSYYRNERFTLLNLQLRNVDTNWLWSSKNDTIKYLKTSGIIQSGKRFSQLYIKGNMATVIHITEDMISVIEFGEEEEETRANYKMRDALRKRTLYNEDPVYREYKKAQSLASYYRRKEREGIENKSRGRPRKY